MNNDDNQTPKEIMGHDSFFLPDFPNQTILSLHIYIRLNQ